TIWTARIKAVYKGDRQTPFDTAHFIITYVQELDGINQKLHVRRAVQIDLVLGFLEVEIEGDALTIVKKLHAIREDRYEISAYIRSSISLSESYQSCFFGHAPKQGKRVAHLLAIEGIKRGVSTYLTQGMPFSAAIEVENDWW
ncbi:hypothetical protein Gogos_015122, partial [Gossypium gossypioides]|nr:hypothetical protein [Gossypium gossypioides]